MACIHAQYYTNVQTVLNTPKLIPYLNQGTQKIPAHIFFLQKNPGIENFNLPDRVCLNVAGRDSRVEVAGAGKGRGYG